ncbi:glycosyltransferase family 2 protein [Microbacterium indicum]|uniref:glycosyltransferase family 2 protein n=1 Tax=Microbacterium indicum TaxID=358100 RepID=UPI00041F22BA|nr:glycosyltransferase family 2 protein [Microbacterium indicum]
MKSVAFVLPIYDEEGNIPLLYERLAAVAAPLADRYAFEFVFVDDGSRDRSLALLRGLRERDERVSVYSLARNSGHQIAVTAGIDVADADAVIVMDSDLQDPPEVAAQLIAAWEGGADVAYAQRRTRDDGFFKRLTAGGFYWVLSKLARIDIPRDTGDFRLMDRKVVEELRRYPEHNRFIRGMVADVGFVQRPVLFDRDARHAGKTGYPLSKMLKLAADGILGFSSAPLRFISGAGVVLAIASALWVVYLALQRWLNPDSLVEGWTFIMAGMFLLGGIQLLMLGIIGQYIGRIYEEVQARPLYAFAVRESGPRPR